MTTAMVPGGHHLVLDGAPSTDIETLPAPSRVLLPRRHRFVPFSTALVAVGDRVSAGQALAQGPAELEFPLVAPVAGMVADMTDDAIVLTVDEGTDWTAPALSRMILQGSTADELRARVRDAGLWPTIHAAPNGEIPLRFDGNDRPPAFLVIGAAHGEPYLAHPNAVLNGHAGNLQEAVEVLRRLSGAPRVVLVGTLDLTAPNLDGVEVLRIPARAPNDNVLVQCDVIDRGAYAWGVDVQDALAIRDAVVEGRVPTERIIALAGGLVHQPKHLRVKIGTPLREVTRERLKGGTPHFLNGGTLTGEAVSPEHTGIAPWARGVNVLPQPEEREFLSFLRPGSDRDSFLPAFLSALAPSQPRLGNVSTRGERRACVNCTACQWVCPVELLPSVLWKYSTHDLLDEAVALGLNRCVECGLCSYVCPSKIELTDTFRRAHEDVRTEQAEERAMRAAE